MKLRNSILLFLCMTVFWMLTGCNTSYAGNSSNLGASDSKAEAGSVFSISSANIESSSSQSILSSPDSAVNEFLNSTDGKDYQIAVKKFTEAYFRGDVSTVKSYLIDPNNKFNDFNTKDLLADTELLNLKLGSEDIKDNSVHAQYEFLEKGDDSYTYLDLEMEKVNNEWKVESYGLEK